MRVWTRIIGIAAIIFAVLLIFAPNGRFKKWTDGTRIAIENVLRGNKHPVTSPYNKQHPLRVMAVGGSSAQGYDDPQLDGYLARALRLVSSRLGFPITFVNKAHSGNTPTMYAPDYDPTIHQVRPDVVIISWGLLNSISRKTPTNMFQRVITSEVKMAVKYGAQVWVVTPPVTPATYVGHDVKLEQQFVNLEINGANAVHDQRVHVFNLLASMKQYLAAHHLSYKPYESNNWHMNRAGHILAGKILGEAITKDASSLGLIS